MSDRNERRDERARVDLRSLPRPTLRGLADDPRTWARPAEERDLWQSLPDSVHTADWSYDRVVAEADAVVGGRRTATAAYAPVWRQSVSVGGREIPVWVLVLGAAGVGYALARGGSGGEDGGR